MPSRPDFTLAVPSEIERQVVWAPDSGRFNGLHIMGGPGSGKSRLGGLIGFSDFLRHVPQVILDPTGGTIDNFIDKVVRLPRKQQERCWRRIRYVDMSGKAGVVAFPLYYRLTPDERPFITAQRYLEVLRRMDPALEHASVMGWNALYKLGTYTGMILAALGLQITEAEDLIRSPERWESRLEQALESYPEVGSAVAFFHEFVDWKPDLRASRSESFLTKILPFSADPSMAAMFGTSTPGLDWKAIVDQGQTVLLDFRHELTGERRRFKLLWAYTYLLEFLKLRGIAGRRQPISVIIDEVTQLLGFRAMDHAVMAQDIEELVSVIARNYGVQTCICHQSLAQIDPTIQSALMQMGTQIIGVMPNPDDALYLARQLYRYNPYRVRKTEPVWMNIQVDRYVPAYSEPRQIDYTTTEFTAEEQQIMAADLFRNLGRFRFIVRVAASEGNIAGQLKLMSIENIDRGMYPDDALIAEARRRLAQRDALPLATALAEIRNRQLGGPAQARTQHAILSSAQDTDHENSSDSVSKGGAQPAGTIWTEE